MKKYFSYDDMDGIHFHETMKEAIACTEKTMETMVDDEEWFEEVKSVCCGEIKMAAVEKIFFNGDKNRAEYDYDLEDI